VVWRDRDDRDRVSMTAPRQLHDFSAVPLDVAFGAVSDGAISGLADTRHANQWIDQHAALLALSALLSRPQRSAMLSELITFVRGRCTLAGLEGVFLTLLHGADLAGDRWGSDQGRRAWHDLRRNPQRPPSRAPFAGFLDLARGRSCASASGAGVGT
jgi:hypothetical protein